MTSCVNGYATLGIDAYIVYIEADISSQIPAFSIVGLPDSAVKESRDRVMAAIKNAGRSFPNNRITGPRQLQVTMRLCFSRFAPSAFGNPGSPH